MVSANRQVANSRAAGTSGEAIEFKFRDGGTWLGGGNLKAVRDGGATWHTEASFPGVPEFTYVSDLEASQHDADTVYAVIDNHKRGDYKPYVLKSTNRGRSWKSISADLPERGFAHSIAPANAEVRRKTVPVGLGQQFGLVQGNQRGAHIEMVTLDTGDELGNFLPDGPGLVLRHVSTPVLEPYS